ncbi:Hypothetical predicted protein [Olea europaea subsp. europaea]|uniref:Uncharacterized protein n=1 Tax=Olea europaea subsp. europaea TaxID=158383 RepID=A0A8S0U3X5_OLEEU|nr:Hypothetical predicted protein [Olea europaea subsp. europaea]CAA3016463.1 Hypothetical predicted protein [Olea europaea subsp. europaea]
MRRRKKQTASKTEKKNEVIGGERSWCLVGKSVVAQLLVVPDGILHQELVSKLLVMACGIDVVVVVDSPMCEIHNGCEKALGR